MNESFITKALSAGTVDESAGNFFPFACASISRKAQALYATEFCTRENANTEMSEKNQPRRTLVPVTPALSSKTSLRNFFSSGRLALAISYFI